MPIKKITNETTSTAPTVSLETTLRNLLKSKTPGIFDREPHAGFAQGNFDKLVADIINLFN